MKSRLNIIKNKILEVILSNLVPPSERKIGVEVETFFYNKYFSRIPVNKGREYSAENLMKDLSSLQKTSENPSTYSLEPGGQLEWASSPYISLHDIKSQYNKHLDFLRDVTKKQKIFPVDLSIDPIYEPKSINLINMKKYLLMNKMFLSTGTMGSWMMKNSASVQINIDMTEKKDGEQMAFIADSLQPLFSLLFANSPFAENKLIKNNFRLKVWNNTDKKRCGNLMDHKINNFNRLLDSYIEYILTVPTIFAFENTSKNVLQVVQVV